MSAAAKSGAADAGYVRKSEACVESDVATLKAAVDVLDSWGYSGVAGSLSVVTKNIERDLQKARAQLARSKVAKAKGNGG